MKNLSHYAQSSLIVLLLISPFAAIAAPDNGDAKQPSVQIGTPSVPKETEFSSVTPQESFLKNSKRKLSETSPDGKSALGTTKVKPKMT